MYPLKFTRRQHFSLNHWASVPFAVNRSCNKKKSKASFSPSTYFQSFPSFIGTEINMLNNQYSTELTGKQYNFLKCKDKLKKQTDKQTNTHHPTILLHPKWSLWHAREYSHLLLFQGKWRFFWKENLMFLTMFPITKVRHHFMGNSL